MATDFRSARMESSEGRGIARRAWDAYANAVKGAPGVQRVSRKLAIPLTIDSAGFWLLWHLEGGFEGMRRMGMSRASIYRHVKLFRLATGQHPDEFEFPGVTVDLEAYWEDARQRTAAKKAAAKSKS